VLADGGSYDGFDVVAEAVAWCRQAITPRFPHFRFRHADVRSGFYNPDAPAEAGSYVFPHASGSKDFVLLTSVFTHLLPRDLDHYLDEIARVLRPGGTCFATFFLFNEESARFVRAGFAPGFGFVHHGDGYRTLDAATPEAAVAYDEAAIRTRLAARELRIVEPVRYGHWCGRPDGLSLQDIIVATRA
jgi:SAM-dependent methyltransferase